VSKGSLQKSVKTKPAPSKKEASRAKALKSSRKQPMKKKSFNTDYSNQSGKNGKEESAAYSASASNQSESDDNRDNSLQQED